LADTKSQIVSALFLLCVLVGRPAFAGEDSLSAQYQRCHEKAVSTLDMHACITNETKFQDVRLNKAFKELSGELSPDRAKQLLEVQRIWIRYRDANCNFYLDTTGGTLSPVQAGICKMNTTASRAKELEDFTKP
jgi:uncharacterized protein YecT (DUF1311 family)